MIWFDIVLAWFYVLVHMRPVNLLSNSAVCFFLEWSGWLFIAKNDSIWNVHFHHSWFGLRFKWDDNFREEIVLAHAHLFHVFDSVKVDNLKPKMKVFSWICLYKRLLMFVAICNPALRSFLRSSRRSITSNLSRAPFLTRWSQNHRRIWGLLSTTWRGSSGRFHHKITRFTIMF